MREDEKNTQQISNCRICMRSDTKTRIMWDRGDGRKINENKNTNKVWKDAKLFKKPNAKVGRQTKTLPKKGAKLYINVVKSPTHTSIVISIGHVQQVCCRAMQVSATQFAVYDHRCDSTSNNRVLLHDEIQAQPCLQWWRMKTGE